MSLHLLVQSSAYLRSSRHTLTMQLAYSSADQMANHDVLMQLANQMYTVAGWPALVTWNNFSTLHLTAMAIGRSFFLSTS